MVMAMLWDLEGRPCTSLKLIGVFDMRLSEKRGSTQWVGSLVGRSCAAHTDWPDLRWFSRSPEDVIFARFSVSQLRHQGN